MWSSGHVFFSTLRPHVSVDSRVLGCWEMVPHRKVKIVNNQRLCPQLPVSQEKKREKDKPTLCHTHLVSVRNSIQFKFCLLPLIAAKRETCSKKSGHTRTSLDQETSHLNIPFTEWIWEFSSFKVQPVIEQQVYEHCLWLYVRKSSFYKDLGYLSDFSAAAVT